MSTSQPWHGNVGLIVLSIGLSAVVFFGIGYYAGTLRTDDVATVTTPTTTQTTTTPTGQTATPTPTDPTANWKTYTDTDLKISFSYPSDWFVHKDVDNNNLIFLTDSSTFSSTGGLENGPAYRLKIVNVENPKNLSMREYYNGTNAPDLFQDASRGTETLATTSGLSATKFKHVLGMVSPTVAVVESGNRLVELEDTAEAYQANGIFDQILRSIELTK